MKKRYHKSGQPQRKQEHRRDDTRRDNSSRHDSQGKKPTHHGKPHTVREAAPQHAPRLSGALLWGTHAVRAAIANRHRHILRLIATETSIGEIESALDEARANGIKRTQPEILDKAAFDRLLPQGTVHQCLVAVIEPLPVRDAHDLIAGLGTDAPACIVILDQVTDPHNVGAILRSAAAFGATGVIMQDRHAPDLTGVLAKTACGAADVIPVALETNLSRAIETLQEHGFFVTGLDERGEDISKLPRHARTALVLGAEGAGIRRLVAEHCDALAALPTVGEIRSLNVSNAAAVALYALKVS